MQGMQIAHLNHAVHRGLMEREGHIQEASDCVVSDVIMRRANAAAEALSTNSHQHTDMGTGDERLGVPRKNVIDLKFRAALETSGGV